MSFRLGIIGAGSIARFHAEAAAAAGLEVAVVCDVDRERAESLADSYPGAAVTTSVDELLAKKELPAVVVAVPNHLHKDYAIRAVRAGKDVLLEKPMATSVVECRAIMEAVQRTDRLVQMGFVGRHSPASVAVRELIEAGRLGEFYHAKASLYRRRGIPGLGRWFTTRSKSGGGVLIDLGVHLIDLVMHLGGSSRPTRASGVCWSRFGSPIEDYEYTEMWSGPPRLDGVFDVEDAAAGLIRFDNGLTLELNTTWAANICEGSLTEGITLLGDRGGCWFDVWGTQIKLATGQDDEVIDLQPRFTQPDTWVAAWERQYEHFVKMVTERARPDASLDDGRKVQAVIEALYRSSREDREVEVG